MASRGKPKRAPQSWAPEKTRKTPVGASGAQIVPMEGVETTEKVIHAGVTPKSRASSGPSRNKSTKKTAFHSKAYAEVLEEYTAISERNSLRPSSSQPLNTCPVSNPCSSDPQAPNAVDLEDPDNLWPQSNGEGQELAVAVNTTMPTFDAPSAPRGRRTSDVRTPAPVTFHDLSSEDKGADRRRDADRPRKARRPDFVSPYRSVDHEKRRRRRHSHHRRDVSISEFSSSPRRPRRGSSKRSPSRSYGPRRRSTGSRDSESDLSEFFTSDPRHRRHTRRHSSRRRRDSLDFSPRSGSPGTPPVTRSGASPRLLSSSAFNAIPVKQEGGPLSVGKGLGSTSKRSSQLMLGLSLNKESVLRRERRERETNREEEAAHQESIGKKKHLVHVSPDGKPYGYGVTTWNDALAKVVRGLDPSFIDIRQQPFQLMETLLKRLTEDFKYTGDVNQQWLRTRIGNALSSYRHELMKMITAKHERPAWVSEATWSKLVAMEGSEKFRAKSEAMRHANACRRNKGRTGPLGEVGVRERLRIQLGRSPEPEDVYAEMARDKGYSRKSKSADARESAPRRTTDEDDRLPTLRRDASSEPSNPSREARTSPPVQVVHSVSTPRHAPESGTLHRAPSTSQDSPGTIRSNPRSTIILKQIADLRKSSVGATEDGLALIGTLELQLSTLRQKDVGNAADPSAGTDEPRHHSTSDTEVVFDNLRAEPAHPKQVQHAVHPAQARTTEPGARLRTQTAVATRKSGRQPKRKIRDESPRIQSRVILPAQETFCTVLACPMDWRSER
ncbi:hypothetical protein M758_UG097200 [Ceratodon purpureus]|nr:hypothetical protein M758_UG097200 [Ceratodon purpureus]